MGVKCSNDQEKYGRKATCHPERNASGVEGSSDSVKMRCELNARRLGVPLPMGKVGLYRKAARAHLRHPRAALATEPCSATPWSLSLTQFICTKRLQVFKSVVALLIFKRNSE